MRNLVTFLLFSFLAHMSMIASQQCPGGGNKYADGSCGLIVGRDLCPELASGANERMRQSQDLLGIKLCSINLIRNENEWDKFFDMGGVQSLFFIQDEQRQTEVSNFLSNYNAAAKDVCAHGISMGIVSCSTYKHPTHCSSETRARFVYMYRGGHEVEAIPFDKFPTVDAIVAPALQHTLGSLITIVQTPNERKELEMRNVHKKDVIFAYVDGFSSIGHHHFLELAKAYKDKFAFGLTTYRVSAAGLPKPDNFAKNPGVLWVLQCSQPARKEVFDDRSVICPATLYNGGHKEIHDFLGSFGIDTYHEFQTEDLRHQDTPLRSPFHELDLPYAIFVFDYKSEGRVRDIVPGLAQFFRGNIAIHMARQDIIKTPRISDYIGINIGELRPPAIVFFKPGQGKPALSISDFESPYDWLNERLKKYLAEKNAGEVTFPTLRPKEDTIRILTQDDELVNSMKCESTLTSVSELECPKGLKKLVSNIKESAAIAFYLPYDPLSNKMLQVLHQAGSSLQDLNSGSTVHKFNCFDYTNVCDELGITNFPTLSIFDSRGNNFVYTGAMDSESVIKAVLIASCSDNPRKISSKDALESFLHRDSSCPTARSISTRVVGIFPDERAIGNAAFESLSDSNRREFLFGHVVDPNIATDRCPTSAGCVIVSKPDDPFQKFVQISDNLRDKDTTLESIRKASLELMGALDPRRELVYSSIEKSSSSRTHVMLILKSTPCKKKLQDVFQSGSQGSRELNADDVGLLAAVGMLANEFSRPGLVFSYVDTSNSMRETVMNDYKLASDRNHLIALDANAGQVSVFASASWTESSIRKWFENILAKNVAANLVLPSGDWKPTLQGFDYISNLRTKYDREDVKLFAFERAVGLTKVVS